jgi:hypothetical protein
MDLLHAMVGGDDGLRRTAAALTRTHVWRVPVPPAMLGVRLLVVVVVLAPTFRGGALQGSRRPWLVRAFYIHSRPGRRVVTSWRSHRFPSGSSNEANEK